MAGVFGVDEAGKGPVLGPMVAAAVAVPNEGVLPAGIDDSKNLTPARREGIADALESDGRIDVGVAVVPPARIDDPATDMNALAVEAHAAAIERLPDAAIGICDAADASEERFARRVADRVRGEVSISAEHGADGRHPIVGAASVVAKVERDARIAALKAEYGPVGSGYPSDPTTRTFLAAYVEEHGDLPACARASWKTCEDVLAAADQRRLDEF